MENVLTTIHTYHGMMRSEEHTSELQSQSNLVCRLLLEKKKTDLVHGPVLHKLEYDFQHLLQSYTTTIYSFSALINLSDFSLTCLTLPWLITCCIPTIPP